MFDTDTPTHPTVFRHQPPRMPAPATKGTSMSVISSSPPGRETPPGVAQCQRCHIVGALGTIGRDDTGQERRWSQRLRLLLVIMCPGLIVTVGDNDAGGAFRRPSPTRAPANLSLRAGGAR